jgi:hypothetical protein
LKSIAGPASEVTPLLLLAPPLSGANVNAPPFELALVLVRLDHVASFTVNANHGIMCERLKKLCVADYIADRVRLAIPKATEWKRIADQIDAALIFARADFVAAPLASSLSGSLKSSGFHFAF